MSSVESERERERVRGDTLLGSIKIEEVGGSAVRRETRYSEKERERVREQTGARPRPAPAKEG